MFRKIIPWSVTQASLYREPGLAQPKVSFALPVSSSWLVEALQQAKLGKSAPVAPWKKQAVIMVACVGTAKGYRKGNCSQVGSIHPQRSPGGNCLGVLRVHLILHGTA